MEKCKHRLEIECCVECSNSGKLHFSGDEINQGALKFLNGTVKFIHITGYHSGTVKTALDSCKNLLVIELKPEEYRRITREEKMACKLRSVKLISGYYNRSKVNNILKRLAA